MKPIWLVIIGVLPALFVQAETRPPKKILDIGLVFRKDDKFNGIGIRNGIATAKALFEKKHPGIQVRLHSFPHEDNLESVVLASKKALDANLHAVIGGEVSNVSFVLRDAFKEAKIVLVTPTSTNPSLTDGFPYVFQVCPSDELVAASLTKIAFEKLKPKAIGLIHNVSSPYTSYLSRRFLEAVQSYQKMGIKVPVFEERVIADTDNFEAQIKSFMEKHVTHVVFPAYPSDFLRFVFQAERKGFFPVYIGGDGWGTNESLVQRLVKNSKQGDKFVAYRTWFWRKEALSARGEAFKKEYLRQFRERPNGWGAAGFDSAWVLMSAMDNALDPKDGEQIRENLEKIKSMDLVTQSRFSFGPQHSPSSGVYLFKIDSGGIHFQETL